ncbi:MAG TPA: trigger factor family protein [Candidatus Saccharimonadales bacterium]|nr:trigger factor family protein [Candidatus Saccharimonadales bacterium]
MKYTVNRAPKGKIDINIDVPAPTFDEAYKPTLGTLSRDTSIAGFRPGMAPADVVEKHVGVSKVLNDSASFLINKHLAEIFEKEKLFPIDSPKIAIATLGQGSPFSYTVSFVQKPEVKVGDWKAIKIKKIAAKEVTEADVLESIKNIYEAYKKQKSQSGESKPEEDSGKYIYDAQGNKIPLKDDEVAGNKVDANKIDDEFAKAFGY